MSPGEDLALPDPIAKPKFTDLRIYARYYSGPMDFFERDTVFFHPPTPTCIGGRDQALPLMLGVSSTSAVKTASAPPIMRLIRHTIDRCSGSYLALPIPTWMWHRAVFGGTGTCGRGE